MRTGAFVGVSFNPLLLSSERPGSDALMQGVSDFSEGIDEPPIVGAKLQETLYLCDSGRHWLGLHCLHFAWIWGNTILTNKVTQGSDFVLKENVFCGQQLQLEMGEFVSNSRGIESQ